jgi:DNA-binding protein HU-beta
VAKKVVRRAAPAKKAPVAKKVVRRAAPAKKAVKRAR